MTELKCCPFCGESPTTEVRTTHVCGDVDSVNFSVICEACGTFKTARLKISKKAVFTDVENAMSQVIEAWNKRARMDEE